MLLFTLKSRFLLFDDNENLVVKRIINAFFATSPSFMLILNEEKRLLIPIVREVGFVQ